jgi:amino acid permease
MLALIIAIAAFTYLFMQQPQPQSWGYNIAIGGIVVGLIWFVINRVQLMFLKKKR